MPVYKGNQELPQQFTNPVHCIRMSRDGQVYVCDRGGNRHHDGCRTRVESIPHDGHYTCWLNSTRIVEL